MKLVLPLFIVCFALVVFAITTPDPNEESSEYSESEQDFEDEEEEELDFQVPERALAAAEYFPDAIPRDRVLKMLKRAVELLEKSPSAPKRQCRQDPDIDIDAKNTLRFLTGEPTIGSSTEESSQASSSARQSEEEFCPGTNVIDSQRRISNSTINRILELCDRGFSEKAIKSQYKWFHRQYIPRMRRYQAAG